MQNTIIITDDKDLVMTKSRPIYEGENRVDEIQFLFGENLFPNFNDNCVIMLQAILPYEDEETHSPTTGKMRYMIVDEELYKNRYRMTLPITSVLTKKAGDVILWFMMFDITDPEHVILLKTSEVILNILESLKGSSAVIDDDKTFDVLAKLEHDVEDLKENRMDKHFDYDEENQTIQFYANGVKLGDPIKLDTEVGWKDWEE